MSNDASAVKNINTKNELSSEQVASYLRTHPEFFIEQNDLLAEMSLPHESGNAISLLERQVTILRDRGIDTRQKLANLLENARNNDQLFDTTRSLVLALLRAENIAEIANIAQSQLSGLANIDRCEIILITQEGIKASDSARIESGDKLQQEFPDVFRLKKTHCGAISEKQINFIFPENSNDIHSTAVCPVIDNDEILALIAFGNQAENYFNVNLDTLFLDFIGHVVGAVLRRNLSDPVV